MNLLEALQGALEEHIAEEGCTDPECIVPDMLAGAITACTELGALVYRLEGLRNRYMATHKNRGPDVTLTIEQVLVDLGRAITGGP